MTIKNIIFDMDGVLIDSEPMYYHRLRRFMKSFGITLTRDESNSMVGSCFKEDIEFLKEKLNFEFSSEQILERYQSFTVEDKKHSPEFRDIVMPYAKFLLTKLRDLHLTMAIASSSRPDIIEMFLQQCDLQYYFSVVVSGYEFEKSKPHPEIYNKTMERLCALPEETLVIEDSYYGIAAAKAAGLTVVARKDDRFGFDQSTADYIVDSLYESLLVIQTLL